MFRIKLSPDSSGGGDSSAPVVAAPSAAPSVPSSISSDPSPSVSNNVGASTDMPAGASPAPAGAQSSPQAPSAGGRVIDSLPERGTPEYWEKFDTLSGEDRIKVEQEIRDVEAGLAEPPKARDPNAPPVAPADPSAPQDDAFLDQAWIDSLPETQRNVISEMQKSITELAPFADGKFVEGLEFFMQDPLIKQRVEEISSGKVWEPGALAGDFNAESLFAEVSKFDPVLQPEEFASAVKEAIIKANTEGLQKGQTAKEYEMRQQIIFKEREAQFDKGFTSLADLHPELKSKDPSVKSFADPKHPMSPFIKWAAQYYRDDFFTTTPNAFESAYASYLASNGTLSKSIQNQVSAIRTNFIRNLDSKHKEAVMAGRNTSSAPYQAPQLIPGVDTERYLSDRAYSEQVFDNADYATRLKLESLRNGSLK